MMEKCLTFKEPDELEEYIIWLEQQDRRDSNKARAEFARHKKYGLFMAIRPCKKCGNVVYYVGGGGACMDCRRKRSAILHSRPVPYATIFRTRKLHELPPQWMPKKGPHGEFMIQCFRCHEYFAPTRAMVYGYLKLWDPDQLKGGSTELYCGSVCKELCPMFGVSSGELSTAAKARNLAQLQRKTALKEQELRFGYNSCERCGAALDASELELHHSVKITRHNIESLTNDNLMLVCKQCHRYLDRNC